jgi:alkylresorcinol/alkylpyrone synthase
VSRIVAVAPVLPPGRHAQREVTAMVREMVLPAGDAGTSARARLLDSLHANAGVHHRHTALPLADYPRLRGFTDANDAFLRVGVELAHEATSTALKLAGLTPSDVDLVLSTTVTGLGAPSLEARLVGPLGLRPDVKRIPVFGLGCVAGVAGLARVHDHLVGHPDDVAVLLSVELCSLTLQRDDTSTANLVASGLFGDGATAVVVVGDRRAEALGLPGPEVVATRSRFYPDTEGVMGWDVGGTGFRIVLSASVADVVQRHLGADVDGFLDAEGLGRGDVAAWLAHPGGPKVLTAIEAALGLDEPALHRSRAQLADAGNLSSSSVLHVLHRAMTDGSLGPGDAAVMMAMGPGFCAELALLRWSDDTPEAHP